VKDDAAISAADKAKVAARNTIAFLGDGTFFNLGSAFIEANTVLPTFVSTLTRSPLLIGLVSTIRSFGYLVPQIFVAGFIERLAWKKPFMMRAGLVMRVAVLGMALSALLGARNPELSLALFFACLILLSFGDGFSGLPWMDLVAKTIPAERRAGLFGKMQATGGVAAFLGGFLIQRLLGTGMKYPFNYFVVMMLGFVFLCGSLLSMQFIQDPGGRVPDTVVTMKEYLRSLPAAWKRNVLFQKVIYTRLLMGGIYLAQPFFAIHAQVDLHFAPSTVGIFVSAQMVGIVAGGPLWGYLGDNHGAHWVVRLVTVSTMMTGALALAARAAFFAGLVPATYALYFLLYFFLGASFGGTWIGFTNYIMDIASEETRATLIGLLNTIAAPLTLLTLAGGWFLQVTSFAWLFLLEATLVFASVVAAWRLPDPREHRS
jgi:MFS family permease